MVLSGSVDSPCAGHARTAANAAAAKPLIRSILDPTSKGEPGSASRNVRVPRRGVRAGGLLEVAQADGRKVGAFQLAYPPLPRPRAGARVGKTIFVEVCSNVARGTFRKRIGIQQRHDARATLEKTKHEILHPRIRPHVAEGCEPQLPVEA